MKMVINRCYGGFDVADWVREELGIGEYDDIPRSDERLVKLVEADSEKASGGYSELKVVEIPDEATDWDLTEYDGAEGVIYVLDGKLHYM